MLKRNSGGFMYFGIYPEYMVDDIKLSGKRAVLIRICDDNWHYELKNKYLYSNELVLNIKDMPLNLVDNKFREELKLSFVKLNKFIIDNDFDEIVVHCGAGVSRSPAIMICIARMLGNEKIEQIVKDNFNSYNRAIVNEFEKFNFKVKSINFENIVYKGIFISDLENIYFDDLFVVNKVLKKKR